MSVQIGEIVAEKYRIVRLLGKGGMGEVYEGENTRIRRRVAIKTLLSNVSSKPDVVQRFEREAQAAGRIGSEHIVEVLDLGDLSDGSRFMVMEFLDGTTLSDRIISRGRILSREAARVVSELLDGLNAAHQAGIIHRDLKPANVFLVSTKQGRPDFVKILDFGVSKFSVLNDEMSMTSTGAVVGTPYYMSPEQAKGAKFIDARSDLYSVGVILYETITGQVPFNAQTFNELIFKIALEAPPPPESFVPDLDPRIAAIMRKAMARESAERYQTAREFKEALDAWASEVDRGIPANNGTMVGWTAQANPQVHHGMAASQQMAVGQPQMGGYPQAPGGYPAVGQAPQGGYPSMAQNFVPAGGTQMIPGYGGAPQPTPATPAPTVIGQAPGLPTITPTPRSKSSMMPVFAILGVVVLGGLFVVGALFLRSGKGSASESKATASATATAKSDTKADTTKSTATAATSTPHTDPTEAAVTTSSATATPSATTQPTTQPTGPTIAQQPDQGQPQPPPHIPPVVVTTPTTTKPPPPPPPPGGGRTISGSL
jgi:eukaryotic-like serine/threonine-protein kinase